MPARATLSLTRSLALLPGARAHPAAGGVLLAFLLQLGAVACAAPAGGELGAYADGPGASVEDGWDDASEPAARGAARQPVHPLDERPAVVSLGLDSVRLAAALEQAARLPRLHNMIVARHGQVMAERHFRGPGPDRPANVKSASKSVLSALVGIAVAEGYLEGVDQPIVPFFARYLDEQAAEERGGITLGHLLSMRSGLESTSNANYGRWVTSSDWVRHAITRPLLAPPGQRRMYSTGSTHLVSAILTQATGQSTLDFARTHLAQPLGITLPPWPRDPQGIYFGGNDMLISPRGLLRFGELFRNGGTLDGKEIVPESWVRDSWDVVQVSGRGNNRSYGLAWFGRPSNGYEVRFAWGFGGQFLFVVPALELTVVFTSDPVSPREGPHNQALHRMIDELLVPAAIEGATAAVEGS